MLAAALCVAWRLSVEEQGIFFVFLSFGALLQLGDAGLSYATLQTASHFKTLDDAARFAAFRDRARRLNLITLSLAALLIGGLGALIFLAKADASVAHWKIPWVLFIGTSWAAQLANLEITMIEGGRSPMAAWRFRCVQEASSGILFIAALIAGAGLWSLCLYVATRTALAVLWLSVADVRLEVSVKYPRVPFDWRKEVWPFQWRIGLSTLSGFLIFQAFSPIVLMEQGPAAAGRFGMSLAMMNMLLLITTVWPLSQVPRYVGLLSQKRFTDARGGFRRMLGGSSLFAILITSSLFLGVWWITEKKLPFAYRFADLMTTGALLATAVVHHVVQCFAVVLRAERREPLLAASIFGGLLTLLVVWASARYGDLRDIALANLACSLVGIPIVMVYYRSLTNRGFSVEQQITPAPGSK
jgi:hypothetical protein